MWFPQGSNPLLFLLRIINIAEVINISYSIFYVSISDVHLLSKLSRTHSKSSNDDFAKFKQCERVIFNLG
jgi:hypothetical protein